MSNKTTMSENLQHELNGVEVVAEGQNYPNANVYLYPHWVEIYTSREQPNTEMHLWVPNDRVDRIVEDK